MDANGYMPVSLEQVLEFFDGVEHRPRITREQWLQLARGIAWSGHDDLFPASVAPTAAEMDGEA